MNPQRIRNNWNMRGIWVGMALLLVSIFATPAQAQVATAEVAPVRAEVHDPTLVAPSAGFVPVNPATLQWGAPSRWGMGQIRAEREHVLPDPTWQTIRYKGIYGGFRKTGEGFSFAGETIDLSDTTTAGNTADWNVLSGAASFQAGENFTFGIGLTRTGDSKGATTTDTSTTLLGMSTRIGRAIFAGLALGTENIEIGEESSNRGVQIYGVGMRGGSTTSQWHLEGSKEERKEATDFQNRWEYADLVLTNLTAEFQTWKIFVGATATNGKRETFGREFRSNALEIGYMSTRDLSIIYRREQGESTGADGSEQKTRAHHWAFSYIF